MTGDNRIGDFDAIARALGYEWNGHRWIHPQLSPQSSEDINADDVAMPRHNPTTSRRLSNG